MSAPTPARFSADGSFPNGTTAAAIHRFVLDHDESARIAEVARYFGLTVADVSAALAYCGAGVERLVVVHGHREGGAAGGRGAISTECLARVQRAEQVALAEEIRAVLFCGAGAAGHPSEARQMAARWRGPDVHALLDEQSVDTPGNVDEAVRWARALRCEALVVVSSWWHLRLRLYYRRHCPPDIAVRHVRCWRCRRLVQRIANELRCLPRVWFPRDASGGAQRQRRVRLRRARPFAS